MEIYHSIVLLFNSSIHILHRMLNCLFIKTSCEQSYYSTISHPSQNTHFPAFDVAWSYLFIRHLAYR